MEVRLLSGSQFVLADTGILMNQTSHLSPNSELQDSLRSTENLLQKNFTAEGITNCQDADELKAITGMLKPLVSEKTEQLRKLKMVQHYRSKKDPEAFELLIEKWRSVAQQAFLRLHELIPDPKPELVELVNGFQANHELVRFDADEGTFTIEN